MRHRYELAAAGKWCCVPVVGRMRRTIAKKRRAAERLSSVVACGAFLFLVSDGDRYTARSHVVAIVSTSSGDVALEQQ